MVDFTKIKLVIWDLDETFWKGILSEGTAVFDDSNAKLIRDMTDAGVISSICSKNDEQQVDTFLELHGIKDLFVFNSINWAPKGPRVQQIVSEMNLRAPNVLFIDDNPTNLGEAIDSCPDLMVSDESILPALKEFFSEAEKRDPDHKRLKQYRVLQEKQSFRATADSNDDFLRKCNIQVQIKTDCLAHLDRIEDLVMRSNQLNFTKVRSSAEELQVLMTDDEIKSGYVEVHDKFGDYGIVGFYAVKDNELLHFVFSCRTLNMGVEQYVYYQIGKPKLTVVGDVSSSLDAPYPDWINQTNSSAILTKKSMIGRKVLIKGPCDMQQMFSFIKETSNIITEFNFVNNRGVQVESWNHTTQIVESLSMSDSEKKHFEKTLPFGDANLFKTRLFERDMGAVVFSLFTDPNLGLYQEKSSGTKIAFGEYTNDLTDPTQWDNYISGNVFNANCQFKREDLVAFQKNYQFLGRITPEEIIENLTTIYERISEHTLLILCLGSETAFEGNHQPAYEDRHLYHQKLNSLIRRWAANKDRVQLLDVNDFVTSQNDFTNNINHFTKEIYYQMCEELILWLNEGTEKPLQFATERDKKREVLIRKIKKIPNKIMRTLHGAK